MGDRLRAGIPSQYVTSQPCIPPGSLNRVPALAGVRAGMSPLCDPMWHVSSRSGVATLQTAIRLLLSYLLPYLLTDCVRIRDSLVQQSVALAVGLTLILD